MERNIKLQNILIRILSIIMVMAMNLALLVCVLVPSSATEANVPTLDQFRARRYSESYYTMIQDKSVANVYYASLEKDLTLKVTRYIWETGHIVAEPSYAMGLINKTEIYRLVLFDLLLGASEDENNILDSLTQAITNDELQYAASISKKVLENINESTLKDAKVTANNMSVLQKVATSTATENTFKAFSAISDISSVYNNMEELIEA